MFRPLGTLSSCVVTAATMLVVALAWADLEEDVLLHYRTEGACPAEAAFVAQVRARTHRARFVDPSAEVREFDVSVRATGDGATGKLTIRTPGGPPAFRHIEGRSCDEVVAALALITALAIDPKAKTAPLVEPDLPGPGADVGPAPTPTTTASAPPPSGAPAPAPPSAAALGPEPRASEVWRWTVGLLPHANSALGSQLSFVLPAYVDALWDRSGLLSPSFRLAVSYLPSREITLPAASADFFRIAGHLSGCPVRFELPEPLAVVPCLGVEVGGLHGSGNLEPMRDAAALWLAVTTAARLQLTAFEWVMLEIQGEFGAALLRPRFYFEPGATIVTVDPVFGTLGGGVGVRFP